MHIQTCSLRITGLLLMAIYTSLGVQTATAAPLALRNVPIFLNDSVAPLNMLVVGRDHKLYYEAYNDASDLDGDGILEIGFKPALEYFGYFDSNKCYSYSSNKFVPSGSVNNAALRTCSGAWSGNWMNWATTARIDALRKVLYGGKRSTDTSTETVLERTYIPQDAHSWGKQYTSAAVDGYAISSYTPLNAPNAGTRHLFANTTLLGDASQLPRFRVQQNAAALVSDWLSIERPVAGDHFVNDASGWVTINPTGLCRACSRLRIDAARVQLSRIS